MSEGRVLGLICARGGSKGLPRKNILPIGGKPLIAWSIEAGMKAGCIDRMVLSTDDPEIAEIAAGFGCEVPWLRPGELATDTASMVDVALHALDNLGERFDVLILLQPTSPFRNSEDVERGYRAMVDSGADSCVAVTETAKPPNWMFTRADDGRLSPFFDGFDNFRQRQQLTKAYVLNGAFYAVRSEVLKQTRSFVQPGTVSIVMPAERSIDIDTPLDARYAEFLLREEADRNLPPP